MPHDPFKVTDYLASPLPEVEDLRRPDFGLSSIRDGEPGFGRLWVEHVGGSRSAARFVLNSYKPASKRTTEAHYHSWPPTEDGLVYAVPAPGRADVVGRALALAAVIEESGGLVPEDIYSALPRALAVDDASIANRWAKRNAALRRHATLELAMIADTMTDPDPEPGQPSVSVDEAIKTMTPAVAMTARLHGAGESTIWGERALPTLARIAEARRLNKADGGHRRMPHAADAWFEHEDQDKVAQALATAMGGKVTSAHRWDVLNLMEGHFMRKLPLPLAARASLYRALGLIDGRGNSLADATPLGGIVQRHAFMVAAKTSASGESNATLLDALSFQGVSLDPSTLWRWQTEGSLFEHAVTRLTAV